MSDLTVCGRHSAKLVCDVCVDERIAALEAELAKVREDNAKLNEALQKSFVYSDELGWALDAQNGINKELLAELAKVREENAAMTKMCDAYADENQRLSDERDAAVADAERLRTCLLRAIEMSDEAWSDLTYRERAMLKPTIDQWRNAARKEGV